jgi:hypothetical protein
MENFIKKLLRESLINEGVKLHIILLTPINLMRF